MKKIGIINCLNVSAKCSSTGCFKAFYQKTGAFDKYQDNTQLISFVHCNGCSPDSVKQLLARAERMKEKGVEIIHLSTCIKAKCPWYQDFIKELTKKYTVEGYTHGKKEN